MDKLFDDISRILASPVPRRKALRLFAGGVASALVAALGPMRGDALDNCGSGQTPCGTTPSGSQRCCTPSQFCCNNAACCSRNVVCCGSKCCSPGDACVNNKCKQQSPSPTSP